MKKLFTLACLSMLVSFVSSAQIAPITGPASGCAGSTNVLADSTSPGGTWSSSNTAIATVGTYTTYSCLVYGVAPGTVTITYTLGASYVTAPYTVIVAPAAITGTTTFCTGATSTLMDATPGGTWSSSSPSVASIDPATGVVTGMSPGYASISYNFGCGAVTTVHVLGTTSGGGLSGPSTVCAGSSITLSDSAGTAGGVWTSSAPTIATVASAGSASATVAGIASGVVTISYGVTGTCGTTYAVKTIVVSSTTSAGTISGASSVTVGLTTSLYDGVGGGTWSSSSSSIASVDPSSGVVSGIAPGSATITYTVSGCGGTADATAPMTVNAFTGISGHVLFSGAPFYGAVKVWLITYDATTTMLQAIDSTTVYCSGSSVYYQFTGSPSDSFRVKAYAHDTSGGTFGYIPTYHTSSFYWNTATVFYHTSGVGDINKDITMLTGTPTSGPGFVGGSVLTGANRGTTGGIPVVGLSMYIVDATSHLMQSTHTDASGNYSFSNLPVGATYTVFPDSLNYLTTPYTSITLATGSSSMTAASFIQHTISHTITPIETGIKNIPVATVNVTTMPNPTSGKLNIVWTLSETENSAVIVTDLAGRQVYATTLQMIKGTSMKQIDLSGLANGHYLIRIKSDGINYNNKIEIQH